MLEFINLNHRSNKCVECERCHLSWQICHYHHNHFSFFELCIIFIQSQAAVLNEKGLNPLCTLPAQRQNRRQTKWVTNVIQRDSGLVYFGLCCIKWFLYCVIQHNICIIYVSVCSCSWFCSFIIQTVLLIQELYLQSKIDTDVFFNLQTVV